VFYATAFRSIVGYIIRRRIGFRFRNDEKIVVFEDLKNKVVEPEFPVVKNRLAKVIFSSSNSLTLILLASYGLQVLSKYFPVSSLIIEQLFRFLQLQIYSVGNKKHLFDRSFPVKDEFDLTVNVIAVK
jgi:hypothetical protein